MWLDSLHKSQSQEFELLRVHLHKQYRGSTDCGKVFVCSERSK